MRSDTVTKGVQQAPHRSLFNALGMTQEELDRPLIGVVSSYNEIVPGHMNLDKITEAVKMGVAMAGGTPIMVPAIAVCDGIAMGHIGMKYSDRGFYGSAGNGAPVRRSGHDPELRQKRARPSYGSGAREYPDDLRQRRPYAGRTCQGRKDKPFQHV